MDNYFEIRRQIFHLCLGMALLFLVKYSILNPFRLFLILIFGIILSFLSRKFKIPVVWWFLKKFEREDQLNEFPGKGTIYFFAGVLLTLKLFPQDIAYASIMVLTLGDSFSHLIGMHIGRIKHPWSNVKLVEGTIAGIFFAFLGAMFFVHPIEALLASIGAMMAEVVEFEMNKKTVDDNLIVPLVAGTVILLVRTYLV